MMQVDGTIETDFKEIKVGLIPAEWDIYLFAHVIEDLISGDWGEENNSQKHDLTDCYVIRGTDFNAVQNGWFADVPIRFVKPSSADKRQLQHDALLIEISGGSEYQPTGRILRITEDVLANAQRPVLFTNFVKQVRIAASIVDPHFFQLFWDYLYSLGRTRVYEKRTTGIRNFKFKDFFAEERISVPPLPEQRRIAAMLNAIQQDIAAQEDIIAEARAFKRSLMQRLFTYGPRPVPAETKETEIGEIPAHWELVRLEELCRQITDGSHFTPTYVDEGVPFLRVTDIKSETIDWSRVKYIPRDEHGELIKRCRPEKGDVLLSKNGTIGRTKVIGWDEEFSIFVSLCLLKPKHNRINNIYLANFLASNGLPQILERGKKMTVTNLHLVEIKELLIPLPSLAEQEEIAVLLADADTKIATEEDRKTALQDFFNATLHQLMTGQIRLLSDEGLPL